ncbi:MAG: glycosyltransferase family 2 protein [Pseudomonadota bacterium]
MTASRLKLSAVAPCFNEGESVGELHRRLSAACRAVAGASYEIVLIDDGSSDGTWSAISALTRTDPHIVAVRLTRNHGHQLALSAGLQVCSGERILIIDADLQDPPELLGEMMALMDDGAHVVYGQRTDRLGESRFKKITAAVFYRVLRRLVDIDVPLDTGDFRLMSRKALDLLLTMPEQHRFIRGMVTWVGLKQTPIEYKRDERFAGETHYPLAKMVTLALDAITGFSTKPLKIASYMGFAFALLSVFGILFTFYSLAFLNTVSGWASMMTVVLFLGSVQLLVLGVFGEYLGRMFMEMKRRPIFMIDEVVSHPAYERLPKGDTEASSLDTSQSDDVASPDHEQARSIA